MKTNELMIIERLKLMDKFDSYIYDNIMNEIDFYVKNDYLKILIIEYKKDIIDIFRIMDLIKEL